MRIEEIQIDLIDISQGRRIPDPNWADAIAADMSANGQIEPIEVVEQGDRFRLIDGLHRIGARRIRGELYVTAKIKTATEVGTEAQATLREIAANFMRRELSILDKARDVARWREIFEQVHGAVKAGRKKNGVKSDPISDDEIDQQSEFFSTSFNAAAQTALGMNKEAIKRYLRIARIEDEIRVRISLHSIADNQSELLALSAETPERQVSIVDLLLNELSAAQTVAGAIAILDHIPVAAKPEAWVALSDRFSKLSDTAKRRFITENWSFIEALLAEKKAA
ncbi:ParB/RepB/Spo0J family partition protein [Agrobacterium vitis]|uniref:ParB/RepB/Spo0J family partition protein n=1 Tax=Agrobacterium vitis TaxID=373 RepID=UPI0015773439|nr:ParB N-terminal domain-containing protein [Agrobacterium vitis]